MKWKFDLFKIVGTLIFVLMGIGLFALLIGIARCYVGPLFGKVVLIAFVLAGICLDTLAVCFILDD